VVSKSRIKEEELIQTSFLGLDGYTKVLLHMGSEPYLATFNLDKC
jgi:hypothetical protein